MLLVKNSCPTWTLHQLKMWNTLRTRESVNTFMDCITVTVLLWPHLQSYFLATKSILKLSTNIYIVLLKSYLSTSSFLISGFNNSQYNCYFTSILWSITMDKNCIIFFSNTHQISPSNIFCMMRCDWVTTIRSVTWVQPNWNHPTIMKLIKQNFMWLSYT